MTRFGRIALVLGFLAVLSNQPARGGGSPSPVADLVNIPGGAFIMGDAQGEPDETPHRMVVPAFRVMRHEVTNAQFASFVADSGYRSDPERSGAGYVWTGRWGLVPGSDWRHPSGAADSLEGKDDHPVVQVSARDAAAFCAHYGMRLPSEVEWEFAARGTESRRYPWGDAPPAQGARSRANFGTDACCAPDAADGFLNTAPAGQYPEGASPFGLLDMAGNVWEWTSSRFPGRSDEVVLRGGGWGNNPYCLRAAYRHGNPPDIGLNMVGFRCAADSR